MKCASPNDLRDAAAFFEPLCKAQAKRHRRLITAMSDLQDERGGLNDLATAPDLLSVLGLSDVAGADDKSKRLHQTAKAYATLSTRNASGVEVGTVSLTAWG